MSWEEEFLTVELLLGSGAETRAVDAFSLSMIKAERQIRKLFTHLIFQFPCFAGKDIPALRKTLASNRKVYFEGFIKGFNTLYQTPIESIIGKGYSQLHKCLDEAIEYRNKIFHGQLTNKYLSRTDLEKIVQDIRTWCARLAEGASKELGYDGFARNSYQKSNIPEIWKRFRVRITQLQEYERFIQDHMERR